MTRKTSFADTVSRNHSLRTRILFALSVAILLIVMGLIGLSAERIRHMSQAQIKHEGLLLSHTLEAAVVEFAARGEVEKIQHYIDHLVKIRDLNDFEVNVVRLRGEGSDIVASNIPDNIEGADEEEHAATLAALRTGAPSMEIETEDGPESELEEQLAADPEHPDYYFPEDTRVLGITTPLVYAGQALGSINVELSLQYLDEERAQLVTHTLAGLCIGCLILIMLLAPFLDRRLFNPIKDLAGRMKAFGMGEDIGAMAPSLRRDEMGVIENEFYGMVARIESGEAMRKELERARVEAERHEMEQKLQHAHKMEALGALAGGIAHDFNNLLTPIMGYTEIMMDRVNEKGGDCEDLGQVMQASVRAQGLVRQILAFSRQSNEEQRPLSVTPIVKETLSLLRASIPMNVDIHTQIEEGDFVVVGNPGAIHQVVLNLATNACHAMLEKGGSLDVRLGRTALLETRPFGEDRVLLPGAYLCLTIEDTGDGIPAELVARIFEPYFTTKKEGEGTGLGLAMVHGIVRDMGGAIDLNTRLNRGARFDVYLPLVESDSCCEEGADGSGLPRGDAHLLIVDDEPSIANMLGSMLTPLGYRCSVSHSPLDALDVIQREEMGSDPISLILSDVAMPNLTGIEFARALFDRGHAVPIVLCSGYTGGINWRTASEVGIRAVIGKPVTRRKLAETVCDVMKENVVAGEKGVTCF